MAIIERTSLLVKPDETTGNQIWIYPITSAENVIFGAYQLDEVVTSIQNALTEIGTVVTVDKNGLMSATDKVKLDGIEENANNYSHPSHTAQASGLYKVTVDELGHVIGVADVTKEDITSLGIPGTSSTYDPATTTTDGLMSSEDKTKLNSIENGANNYSHPSYTERAVGLYKVTVDATGHVSAVEEVAKSDITALGIPSQDTTYTTATTRTNGLMSAADKTKLDGLSNSGEENQNAFSNVAVGSTVVAADSKTDTLTLAAGTNVSISADVASDTVTISATNTTYSAATTTTNGLMTASDKTKLNGIAAGANNYTHPTYNAVTSGLYKITVDETGHVDSTSVVSKSDITALGIPAQDTTYSVATTTTNGLLSSSDKTKLDGIATGANRTTVDTAMSTTSTNPVQNRVVKAAIDAVDTRIDNLVADAPEALDTFKELSDYLAKHQTEYEALVSLASSKVDKVDGKGLSTNDYTTAEKTKLEGIATGAEVNQNAFSNVVVGTTSLAADSKSDTLTITAGSNITLTPNATNDSFTIAATNTTYSVATTSANGLMSSADKTKLNGISAGANNYTHPSYDAVTSGLYKITVDETGHVSATAAVEKADITALGIPSTNTTYSVATTSANGLMSSADKTKLNGIATGAEANQNAFSNIAVGSTTVSADSETDTLTLAAGSNVTITANATSDTITIAATNTTYSAATTSAAGLMSANDKTKLDGIATGANNYTHPAYTAKSSGLYKVTVDATGHVSATAAVAKADITALGIPASDTTYSVATTSANGLMSSADKTKLDGIASGAQVNTITGIKGNAESSYRTGNVNITPANIGLGNVSNTADSAKSVATAGQWTTSRNINGMTVSGAYDVTNYGTCSTAAATVAKVVACTGFALVTGAMITVKFTVTNTAASPTLNVNSTGAKAIYYRGSAINTGYLAANRTYTFRYNGTQYELVGDINTNTTYSVATTSTNGLLSATDKTKLDGIATGANNYTHPSYDAVASGLYKITVDATGHVSEATAVVKADITALGIPATNTTYSVATTSANGLMSSADKTKLNGIATGANNYTHPSYTAKSSGLYKITVDATGHVSATTAVAKADITALGIPAQDTTYSNATATTAGLMSATDKEKVDLLDIFDMGETMPTSVTHDTFFLEYVVE